MDQEVKHIEFETINIIYDIFTVLITLLDILTNILVIKEYYNNYLNGRTPYILLYSSLSIISITQISYCIVFAWRYTDDFRKRCYIFIITLPFAPILPFILYFNENKRFRSSQQIQQYINVVIDDGVSNNNKKTNNSFKKWKNQKCYKHLGFIIQGIFEAFPQSLLQLIAIIYYEQYIINNNYILLLSILCSMINVTSKSFLLSVYISTNWQITIFNWICFVADYFGGFYIILFTFRVALNSVFDLNEHRNDPLVIIQLIWLFKILCTVTPFVFIVSIGINTYYSCDMMKNCKRFWFGILVQLICIVCFIISIIITEIVSCMILLIMAIKNGFSQRISHHKRSQQFYLKVVSFIKNSRSYSIDEQKQDEISQKQDEIIRICCVNKVLYDGIYPYQDDRDFYKYLKEHSIINEYRSYAYSDVTLEDIESFKPLKDGKSTPSLINRVYQYVKFNYIYHRYHILLPDSLKKVLICALLPLYCIGRVITMLFPIFAMLYLARNGIYIFTDSALLLCVLMFIIYVPLTILCIYLFFNIYIMSTNGDQQLFSFILPSREYVYDGYLKYLAPSSKMNVIYAYYEMIVIQPIIESILNDRFGNDISCTIIKHIGFSKNDIINQCDDDNVKKILLLGSGGVGKSTIMKQFDVVFGSQHFGDYQDLIIGQIIWDMQWIIHHLPEILIKLTQETKEEKYEDEETEIRSKNNLQHLSNDAQAAAVRIMSTDICQRVLTTSIANDIECLWNEKIIRETFESRAITAYADTTPYYWKHSELQRISQPNYIPTVKDYLYENHRTTGIVERHHTINNVDYHIWDTGGQKCERRKWGACYGNVYGVIFVVSLNHFNKVLFEDYNTNAMDDAIDLFDFICNNVWLLTSELILLLNKTDLFRKKIKKIPITICQSFADFNGDTTNYEETITYITKIFKKCNSRKNRKIYTHLTCAIDTDNFMDIFRQIHSIVVNKSMQSAGFL